MAWVIICLCSLPAIVSGLTLYHHLSVNDYDDNLTNRYQLRALNFFFANVFIYLFQHPKNAN
jgi:hypothetical protein